MVEEKPFSHSHLVVREAVEAEAAQRSTSCVLLLVLEEVVVVQAAVPVPMPVAAELWELVSPLLSNVRD